MDTSPIVHREVRISAPDTEHPIWVDLTHPKQGAATYAISNLSRHGLFLTGAAPLRHGTKVKLAIGGGPLPQPVQVDAEVRWVRQQPLDNQPLGMGLRLITQNQRHRQAYLRLIEGCTANLTAKDLMHPKIAAVDWEASLEQVGVALAGHKGTHAFVYRTEDASFFQVSAELVWRQLAIVRSPGSLRVADLQPSKITPVLDQDTLTSIWQLLVTHPAPQYPVIDEQNAFLGVLDASVIAPLWHELCQLRAYRHQHADFQRLKVLAHEVRTPVSIIQMYLKLLDRNDPVQADVLRVAEGRCTTMLTLIERYLDDNQILDAIPIVISDFVEGLISDHEIIATAKSIKITTSCNCPPGCFLITDPTRLEQILSNLLSNAIKFSNPGATIKVTTHTNDPGFISFAIADEGPGLCPTEAQSLFSAAERGTAQPTAGEPSHGYGLSLVSTLVQDLGGQIEVAPHFPRGSTFVVKLPQHHGPTPQQQG